MPQHPKQAASDTTETSTATERPMPDATPVGRTDTAEAQPTWEIDGKLYELRTIGDYGIAAQQRLNRDGREFYSLWTADEELTDDQGKRLKFLLERMFNGDPAAGIMALLDAPKTVLRRMRDADKADVVLAFTLAPLRKAALAAAPAQEALTDEQAQTESIQEARDQPSISTS